MKSLTLSISKFILQNTKRLRTFSQPQQTTIIPIDPKIFNQATLLTLIRVRQAFSKLSINNNNQKIYVELKSLKQLQISSQKGSFIIQADQQLSTLFLTSPISGTYKYYYDVLQKRFYSNKDGHLFDQNLTRQTQKVFGDIIQI